MAAAYRNTIDRWTAYLRSQTDPRKRQQAEIYIEKTQRQYEALTGQRHVVLMAGGAVRVGLPEGTSS